MELKSLRIAPQNSFSKPSKDNRYVATVTVGFDRTEMKVELDPEATERMLALVAEEMAAGAKEQADNFVRDALAFNGATQIEASA